MTQNLLTLPIRIGIGAAKTTLGITVKVVETAIDIARPGSRSAPSPAPRPEPPRRPPVRPAESPGSSAPTRRTPAAPQAHDPRINGQPEAPPVPRRPPAPAAPVRPPDALPDTPASAIEDRAKVVDDTDEVIAEFAEPGAEEGAGAQLDIEQPWEGYAEANAETVIARVNQAGAEELAVVELYESTHKKRQTVLNAAARRLRTLSPPETA